MTKPIAVTPGEPAGIGPDIVIKAAQHLTTPIVVIADQSLLQERAVKLGLSLPATLSIHHVPLKVPCIPGKPDSRNAAYVLETLKIAAQGCLDQKFAAMTTGPVSKSIISQAGFSFMGHTDWLGEFLHVEQPLMLFATEKNKYTALYTTHIPLKAVSAALSSTALTRSLEILWDGLKKYFHIEHPRIGVLGLNPHAGEEGLLGDEEKTFIKPVIEALQKKGFNLKGPLSADTAFTAESWKNYDALLAMYHDQALPVIKSQSFGELANVTLGLPIIRTSVDHGTAFPLAGTNQADESSLLTAIQLAQQMSQQK